MTFDNSVEVHKIHDIFPNAELVLRILPENHAQASSDLGAVFARLDFNVFRNEIWCHF